MVHMYTAVYVQCYSCILLYLYNATCILLYLYNATCIRNSYSTRASALVDL